MSVQWPADREHGRQDGVVVSSGYYAPPIAFACELGVSGGIKNKKKINKFRDPLAPARCFFAFFVPRGKDGFLKAMNNSNEWCLASGRGGWKAFGELCNVINQQRWKNKKNTS